MMCLNSRRIIVVVNIYGCGWRVVVECVGKFDALGYFGNIVADALLGAVAAFVELSVFGEYFDKRGQNLYVSLDGALQ